MKRPKGRHPKKVANMSRKSGILKVIFLTGALFFSGETWSAEAPAAPAAPPEPPPYPRAEALLTVINPHNQIGETGEVLWGTCVVCHKEVPAIDKNLTIKDVKLYFEDPVQLCRSCHTVPVHPTVQPTAMLSVLKKAPNHLRVPPKVIHDNIRMTLKDIPTILPLDPKTGQIICSTCHNPHERGLLPGRADWGADTTRRFRSAGLDICQYCHRK